MGIGIGTEIPDWWNAMDAERKERLVAALRYEDMTDEEREMVDKFYATFLEGSKFGERVHTDKNNNHLRQLYLFERELSNVCSYSMTFTRQRLSYRVIEIRDRWRRLMRRMGYTGVF